MRQPPILCGLLLFALCAHARRAEAQTNPPADQPAAAYRLSVTVDEVDLAFHAADAHGLAVNDLKLDELSLLDNGKPPRKVLAFQSLVEAPIRAAILVDASESMQGHLAASRAIAAQYAQQLLRQQTDQAYVADFVRRPRILQPWTGNPTLLTAAVHRVTAGAGSLSHGTSIFDAIYRTCLYQFGEIDHAASGNFILLFSDGEDNASDSSLQEAVDACQHANTAIYAFRAESAPDLFAPGPRTLAQLANQTGGRVFRENDTPAGISDDLRSIEADLRNQYRLVYRPADLKHDGAFHRIALIPPPRVDRLTIRSGYYAPAH